jgi:hypothetical protein
MDQSKPTLSIICTVNKGTVADKKYRIISSAANADAPNLEPWMAVLYMADEI